MPTAADERGLCFDDAGAEDGDAADPTNDLTGEPTIDRGSHPPRPSTSRRLSPTLARIFARRRAEIGLSVAQVAQLSGIAAAELERFEATQGGHRLVYDHAVLLARVLGIPPHELPGLRRREQPVDVAGAVDELERSLAVELQLTFEGAHGERFGGQLERLPLATSAALRIGDDSLDAVWPRGTVLGLAKPSGPPRPGAVVLLRQRRSGRLALRQSRPPLWQGLAPWQPSYDRVGDWQPLLFVCVVLPAR